MKKLWLLLLVPLLAFTCYQELDSDDSKIITINNLSDKDIYVDWSVKEQNDSNVGLSNSLFDKTVIPSKTSNKTIMNYPDGFKSIYRYNRQIRIAFIDKDIFDNYSWAEIRDNQMVLEFSFPTLRELMQDNWVITYK